MTPTEEALAKSLTPGQRRALIEAKVRPPHSFMPNYHAVELAGIDGSTAEGLVNKGLCVLPIRTGGRSGYSVYHGEITPLGERIKACVMSGQPNDGGQGE